MEHDRRSDLITKALPSAITASSPCNRCVIAARLGEVRAGQVASTYHRTVELGALQIRAAQGAIGEHRAAQVDTGQVRIGEIRPGEGDLNRPAVCGREQRAQVLPAAVAAVAIAGEVNPLCTVVSPDFRRRSRSIAEFDRHNHGAPARDLGEDDGLQRTDETRVARERALWYIGNRVGTQAVLQSR